MHKRGRFTATCNEYFERFDRNHDDRLTLEEVRVLVSALCDVWQVAPSGRPRRRAEIWAARSLCSSRSPS